MKVVSLLVMGLVLLAGSLGLAQNNIYVAQSAQGDSTGADCADAVALPSASWIAGNTYHLCGTITSTISPSTNGTASSPITILFEANALSTVSSSSGAINLAGRSYIVVDGGSNGTIQPTSNNSSAVGIYALGGSNNLEVKNLTIANLYVHSSMSDNSGGSSYAFWYAGSYNKFHDNVIHDAMAGFKEEAASSYNQIYNNQIYNVNWGLFASGSGSANSIVYDQVYNNEIHDFANWDTTNDTFHHDGIFFSGNGSTSAVNNNQIYNNYLYGTLSNCSSNCATAYIYMNNDSNDSLYNNLLVAPAGQFVYEGLITMGAGSQGPGVNDAIYNNTFVGGGSTAGNCLYTDSETGFIVKNNIFMNCTGSGSEVWLNSATLAAGGLDNNVYGSLNWRINSSYYSSLASWQSATGQDANAQATTGSLNLDGNYVPTSNSIAVGAGANLTNVGITALDSDKAGVARPATGAWDAGAYQAGSGPPNPPTGLSAIVK
jgi:hypothetical protein